MNDFYLFVATQFAFLNKHLAFRYAKLFGEEFYQMGVGLAVNGWRGNGDFELVAM